jgi:GxxExxY protein
LFVQFEHPLSISFRNHNIGNFKVDLLVEKKVIAELKAVNNIIGEHKAQLINYLSVSGLPVELIINFGTQRIQTARLEHPKMITSCLS